MGEKGRESYCNVAFCLCLDHLQMQAERETKERLKKGRLVGKDRTHFPFVALRISSAISFGCDTREA